MRKKLTNKVALCLQLIKQTQPLWRRIMKSHRRFCVRQVTGALGIPPLGRLGWLLLPLLVLPLVLLFPRTNDPAGKRTSSNARSPLPTCDGIKPTQKNKGMFTCVSARIRVGSWGCKVSRSLLLLVEFQHEVRETFETVVHEPGDHTQQGHRSHAELARKLELFVG